MAGPPFYVGDARAYPHCDLFFLRGEPGKWQALVYNTIGLSRCPPGQLDFKVKTLERNLILDARGVAHIVSDDLENIYQGCTEDVSNFDPWA